MITKAIGKPTPSAPPMINAKAESKFASACTVRPAMLLLHGAPTGIARRPRKNDQKADGTSSLTFSNPGACPNRNDPRLKMYG